MAPSDRSDTPLLLTGSWLIIPSPICCLWISGLPQDLAKKDLACHKEDSKALEPPDLSSFLNQNGPHRWPMNKLQLRQDGSTGMGVPLGDQLCLLHCQEYSLSWFRAGLTLGPSKGRALPLRSSCESNKYGGVKGWKYCSPNESVKTSFTLSSCRWLVCLLRSGRTKD
jgi:hypothetical protein